MRTFFTILLLAFLLVGCSGAEEVETPPIETEIETATSEPQPTETAVPDPTALPTVSEPDPVTPEEDSTEPEEEEEEEANTGAPEPNETEAIATVETDEAEAAPPTTFQLEAWGDNWFAAYLGEELIVEDSVSITTERSFNSETATFEASYPLQLNIILKDFIENDTGLEYIGSNRQQMGDGGFIMQLTDLGSGELAAVTNGAWACTVVHEAPLDKSCESEANPVAGTAPCEFIDLGEPEGWKLADYDDSTWTATTVHTATAVDPKQGYDNITWNDSAEFIWGPDLETNNTMLCRLTVTGE